MSSLRGSPRATASPQNSSTNYNTKIKLFSSFILQRIPGFRRRVSIDDGDESKIRSEVADFAMSDAQRKALKNNSERNAAYSTASDVKKPPLIPSMSESKIMNKNGKATISTKSTKKILVSNASNEKALTGGRSNSPSKQPQASRSVHSEYATGSIGSSSSSSGLKKKHSPTSPSGDYSGSSSTTAGTDSGAFDISPSYSSSSNQYRGGHSHVTSTSSPNVVIFGDTSGEKAGGGRSTAASLLSHIGFPISSNKTESKSKHSAGGSSVHSHMITVKPAAEGSRSSAVQVDNPAVGHNYSDKNHPNTNTTHPPQRRREAGTTVPSPAAAATQSTSHTSHTPAPATGNPTENPAAIKTGKLCCDKCDGKHLTDDCPYYKKNRDTHPDAQKNKQIGGVSSLPGNTLYAAKVVRQPGDGSCLFHSMSYGLPTKSNATRLRAEICQFIQNNPKLKISDTPLQDWVKWDANSSVSEYARRMSRGSWGGGIEMACLSLMKDCNVHVYERSGLGFKRISAFDHPVEPERKPVVRVLYCGGVHYDAIVTAGQ